MHENSTVAATAVEVPATVEVAALDLTSSHTLVGDQGGLSAVYEARHNSLLVGWVTVETEHGYLLFDDDRAQTYTVLAD